MEIIAKWQKLTNIDAKYIDNTVNLCSAYISYFKTHRGVQFENIHKKLQSAELCKDADYASKLPGFFNCLELFDTQR